MAKYVPEEGDELLEDETSAGPKKYVPEEGDEVIEEVATIAETPPSYVTNETKPKPGKQDFLTHTVLPVASSVFDTMTLGAGPSALNQVQKLENFVKGKFGKKPSEHDYRQVVDKSVEEHPLKAAPAAVASDIGLNATLAALTGGLSLTPQAQALQSFIRRANQESSRGKSGYDVINPALVDATATAAIPVLGDDLWKAGKTALGSDMQKVGTGLKMLRDSLPPGFKEKLADFLQRFANRRAVKAVGFRKPELNALEEGADQRVGQVLLDKDLIRPWRDAEDHVPVLGEARKDLGGKIGESLSEADVATGGSVREIKSQVADRRLGDQNLLEAQKEAEGMLEDSFESKLAQDIQSEMPPTDYARPKDMERMASEATETYQERLPYVQTQVRDIAREGKLQATPGRELVKGLGFDGHSFVDAVENRVLPHLEADKGTFGELIPPLKKMIEGYRQMADEGMSFSQASEVKGNLHSMINKFFDAKPNQKAKVAIQGILDDEIQRQMGHAIGPEKLSKYAKLKSDDAAVIAAHRAAKNATRGSIGNNPITPMDAVAAAGAAASGNGAALAKGMGAMGATHLLSTRGSSAAAVGASDLARWLRGANVAKPEVQKQITEAMGPKYGPLLVGAAIRASNGGAGEDLENLLMELEKNDAEFGRMLRGF